MGGFITGLDWSVLGWIHENLSCQFLDILMPMITALGNGAFFWIVAGAVLFLQRKHRRQGLALLLALGACALLGNLLLKPLVARPRPCIQNPNIPLLIPVPHGYSFPSGHAMTSAAGAAVLRRTNSPFQLAAVPLALLIAFSRLYLYVHFPSDVLCGLILGAGIGCLFLRQWPGRQLSA